jgi:uncharacterized membrane protein YkoI
MLQFVHMRRHLIYCLLLLVTISNPLHAEEEDHEEAKDLVESGKIMALEKILEKSQQKIGRILEVELERSRSGYIYEIEFVDKKGVVLEMKFDAATGRLLGTESGDDD